MTVNNRSVNERWWVGTSPCRVTPTGALPPQFRVLHLHSPLELGGGELSIGMTEAIGGCWGPEISRGHELNSPLYSYRYVCKNSSQWRRSTRKGLPSADAGQSSHCLRAYIAVTSLSPRIISLLGGLSAVTCCHNETAQHSMVQRTAVGARESRGQHGIRSPSARTRKNYLRDICMDAVSSLLRHGIGANMPLRTHVGGGAFYLALAIERIHA